MFLFGLEDFINTWLTSYGPWAVWFFLMLSGVGLSVSEDLIIIPAGILVGSGRLDLLPVVIASYSGVVLSDLLWFKICSRYGTPLLHRRWFKRMVHPRRLLQAKHQIEERGGWVLVMARFIPGSRTTTITVAGMLHMPTWKFFAINSSCVVITVPMQLGIGFLIARHLGDMETASMVKTIVGIVVGIIAVVLAIRIYKRFRKNSDAPPRAKMAWIRKYRRRKRDEDSDNGTTPVPPVSSPKQAKVP